MSDSLARVSEVSALQYCDVEPETTTSGGIVHIRASKNDQFGDGFTRYIGPSTLAAVGRYLVASGHTSGALFRRLLRGGQSSHRGARPDSIRNIVRQRVAEVTGGAGRVGGHSLRVGSARELAASGASLAELQQADGWRSSGHAGGLHSPRSRRSRSGCAAALPGRVVLSMGAIRVVPDRCPD